MKRLVIAVAILVSLASRATGQSTQPGQWRSRQTSGETENKKSPAQLLQEALLRVPTLDEMHSELRTHSNLHDTYLYIATVGNEKSVPLLLERLRKDYGASEPVVRPGMLEGFDCAQVHLIDALRLITNTDQGMHYPRWAAWWQKNQDLSQQRWTVDGFAAKGLHVAEPIDEQFGLELIEQVGRNRSFLASNSRRALANVPVEQRNKWTSIAAVSPERVRRLGAIAIFRQFGGNGAENLLRGLSADADIEIRRNALTALNESLRVSLAAPPESARVIFPGTKDNWIRGLSFSGDTLVAAFYNGEVKAFDVRTFQELWTRQLFRGAGDQILVMGDRTALASQEGELAALDREGRTLWQKQSLVKDEEIRRLVPFGDEILVIGLKSVEHVDLKTGAIKSKIRAAEYVSDADTDASGSRAFFSDKHGLHSANDSSTPISSVPQASGISVSSDSVCVTSGGQKNSVSCIAADTMALRWTQPISSNGTGGHQVAPIQDGSRVLVPTDEDISAFSAADGSLQWTTASSQGAQGKIASTKFGFLIENSWSELELRNPANGEVLRNWSQVHVFMQIAVHQQFAAIADFDGKLWIVDIH